ncbi:aldehyde dehydrogenase family protein, partial [Shewanella sp. A3A]|nr:aldehyde dehydrogenase family protein [Shewanella ferrihydritica]
EEYESGRTKELEWRKAQLGGLIRMITEEEDAIFDALHDDLGKHRVESFRDEVGVLAKSVRNTLQNLKKWASPEKVDVPP